MSRHLNPYTRLLLLFFLYISYKLCIFEINIKKPHKTLFTISMDVNRS